MAVSTSLYLSANSGLAVGSLLFPTFLIAESVNSCKDSKSLESKNLYPNDWFSRVLECWGCGKYIDVLFLWKRLLKLS